MPNQSYEKTRIKTKEAIKNITSDSLTFHC